MKYKQTFCEEINREMEQASFWSHKMLLLGVCDIYHLR